MAVKVGTLRRGIDGQGGELKVKRDEVGRLYALDELCFVLSVVVVGHVNHIYYR